MLTTLRRSTHCRTSRSCRAYSWHQWQPPSTGEVEEYGAPPFSVVPSVQLRPQLISPGSLPGEHAMSEVTVVDIRGAGSAEDKLVAQTEFGLGCRRCSKCGGVIRLYRVAVSRLTHTCTVHDASCSAVCQPLLVCVSSVH